MPFTTIRPAVGTSSPQIIFSVVVLPAPFGPTNPKTSREPMRRFRLSAATAWAAPADPGGRS